MGSACTSAASSKAAKKEKTAASSPSSSSRRNGGSLSVASGPMFSGKTTWIIEKVREEGAAAASAVSVACWIPAIDGRSGGRFRAHHKNTRDVGTRTAVFDDGDGGAAGGGGGTIAATPVSEPVRAARQTIASKKNVPKAVAIDEAHMFPAAELGEAVEMLLGEGIDVYVAGLDYDCMRTQYEWIEVLEGVAAEAAAAGGAGDSGAMFKSMLADCFLCGYGEETARWTVRTEPIYTGSTEDMIGGSEKYQPACDVHWKPPPLPEHSAAGGGYVWKLKDTPHPAEELFSSPPAFSPPPSVPAAAAAVPATATASPPPSLLPENKDTGGPKNPKKANKKAIMAATAPHSCYPPMLLDEDEA